MILLINLVAPIDGFHKEKCSHCGSTFVVKDERVLFTAAFPENQHEIISDLHIYGQLFSPKEFGIENAAGLITPINNAIDALNNCIDSYIPLIQRKIPVYRALRERLSRFLIGCQTYPYALVQVLR